MNRIMPLVAVAVVAIFLSGCIPPSSDDRGTALAEAGSFPFTDFQLEHGLYVQNDAVPTLVVEINGTVDKAPLNGDYLSVSQDFIKQKTAYEAKQSKISDQNQTRH